MDISEVVSILQISVGPVILISGVGLLLLSLTNRYGRIIDRSRVLADTLPTSGSDDHHLLKQIQILLGRAKLLRTSITFGAMSVLFAAVLVIGIVCFIQDVNRSLKAIDLDMEAVTPTT